MSGLAPAHRSGPGGPTDGLDSASSASGRGCYPRRGITWDIELTGSAANYTGEPEFCPR